MGQVVGRQGKTRQRIIQSARPGKWAEMESSVNNLIDDLLRLSRATRTQMRVDTFDLAALQMVTTASLTALAISLLAAELLGGAPLHRELALGRQVLEDLRAQGIAPLDPARARASNASMCWHSAARPSEGRSIHRAGA